MILVCLMLNGIKEMDIGCVLAPAGRTGGDHLRENLKYVILVISGHKYVLRVNLSPKNKKSLGKSLSVQNK